jgi:hypothetical protein
MGAEVTASMSVVLTGDLADGVGRPWRSLDPSPKSPRQTMQGPDIGD